MSFLEVANSIHCKSNTFIINILKFYNIFIYYINVSVQGLGVLNSIAFIVSAISSGVIRSKLVSQSRQALNQPAPDQVVGTTATTFVMVPQQPLYNYPQSGYPPNYISVVTAAGGPGIGEHQTVGSYPAVVPSEHYYDMPQLPQSQPQSGVTNKAVHVTTHPGYQY